MIKQISWKEIEYVWKNYLWPIRTSLIETNSSMNFLSGFNHYNMTTTPTFVGYFIKNILVGVNSGHLCADQSYRSRGLWVDEKYRNQGIGSKLLLSTINQSKKENATKIWSYPRKTSWPTYSKVGFKIASDWEKSETSEQNAYCYIDL